MGEYKYFVFIGVILCLISGVFAKDNGNILLSKVIYIDPGHGGADCGAFYKNVKEQASEFSFIKAAQEQATYAQWDKDNETEQEFRNRKSALEKRVRDLRKASEQAASLGHDTFVFDGQTYSFVADADDNVRASRIKTILKESNVYATTHNVSRYDSTTNSWEKVVPNNAEDLRKMEIYATETEGYIKGNQKYARNVANDKAAGVNPNGSGKK